MGCSGEDTFHPRAQLSYRAPRLVEWIWSGALTSSSVVVKVKLAEGIGEPRLRLGQEPTLRQAQVCEPFHYDPSTRIATFQLTGLQPGIQYHYAFQTNTRTDTLRQGKFRTPEAGPHSFTVAFGACAKNGSNGRVFQTIEAHSPLLFLHLGDLHYSNLSRNEPQLYREAFDHVLASPAQSLLYRHVPIVYVWDDHDYGRNSSDASDPGRTAVRRVYQEYVPHYPLIGDGSDVPICQAFTVGRVRFIVTDLRSERTPIATATNSKKTMLGEEQEAWFKEELKRAARRYPLIVWVNTVPWIARPRSNADNWGGYGAERRELANFMAQHVGGKLVMLCGDAHMLAIDDGSNSGYSDVGGPGMPIFHAAALDRKGSMRGGPYSHGSFPGGGQFGLMDVIDQGGPIRVRWSGRRWDDREVLSHEFTVPAELPVTVEDALFTKKLGFSDEGR